MIFKPETTLSGRSDSDRLFKGVWSSFDSAQDDPSTPLRMTPMPTDILLIGRHGKYKLASCQGELKGLNLTKKIHSFECTVP